MPIIEGEFLNAVPQIARQDIDQTNDLALIADASDGYNIKRIAVADYEVRGKTINVLDYGADPTAATTSGAAFSAAVAALTNYSSLVIPSGQYDLSDVTTGFILTEENVAIVGHGMPVLDFGGQLGFQLAGPTQHYVSFSGLHFKNPLYGIHLNGAAESGDTHRAIDVNFCRFTDIARSASDGMGIRLDGLMRDVKITNCLFQNITASGSASIFGVLLNRKDTGDRDYSDGDEGQFIIANNIFRDINNSTTGTDECHGLLVDGWDVIVSNNVFRNITSAGTANCEGVYLRCHGAIVTGNSFNDAGTDSHLAIKGDPSTSYGDMGPTLVTNNNFTTISETPTDIIKSYQENVLIDTNEFKNCEASNSIVEVAGNELNSVKDNEFIDCVAPYIITDSNGAGTNGKASGNKIIRGTYGTGIRWRPLKNGGIENNEIIDPVGPATPSDLWYGFDLTVVSQTGPAINIGNSDNTVTFDSSWAGTGTSWPFLVSANGRAIEGLRMRDNRLYGAAATGSIRMMYITSLVAGNKAFELSPNFTDRAHGEIQRFCDFPSADIPRGTVASVMPGSQYDRTSGTSLVDYQSGYVTTNSGATAAVEINLPAAVPGLIYTFMRLAPHAFRVDPNGTEIIGAGGAGKYVELQNDNTMLVVRCDVAGAWIIAQATGAIVYEA